MRAQMSCVPLDDYPCNLSLEVSTVTVALSPSGISSVPETGHAMDDTVSWSCVTSLYPLCAQMNLT
jgi:hypothetical protein